MTNLCHPTPKYTEAYVLLYSSKIQKHMCYHSKKKKYWSTYFTLLTNTEAHVCPTPMKYWLTRITDYDWHTEAHVYRTPIKYWGTCFNFSHEVLKKEPVLRCSSYLARHIPVLLGLYWSAHIGDVMVSMFLGVW